MELGFVIIGFILLALFFRFLAGSFDGDRVERYMESRGWKLIDRSWDPFGPGWFGEENDRIYEVVYEDNDGTIHRAHVKTSMMSGVYLTNDRVVQRNRPVDKYGSETGEIDALMAENEKLRRQVEELKRRSS